MSKKNYKSDFSAVLRLRDASGNEVPFPDCDWEAVFWTSSRDRTYRASCIGGKYTNCFRTNDGRICVVFDSHNMLSGVLKWEPHFMFPDPMFSDGKRDSYEPEPLDIELVSGKGDCPTTAEIELIAPFIKGDKLTYADLTAEDKADLIAPIKEDIDKAITQKQDVLTTSDDLQISDESELSLTDKAKMQVFIDLWNSACYQYGGYKPDEAPNPAKPFLLNKLWFSYKEALEIYNVSVKHHVYTFSRGYIGCLLKTVLPIVLYSHQWAADIAFNGCENMVRISFKGPNYGNAVAVSPVNYMFAGCSKLEEVLSDCTLYAPYTSTNTANIFQNCYKLREIRFFSAKNSFDIHWSPLLSLASVQCFLKASPPSPITITVHKDVYAKLTGDTTNAAAAALTADELARWQQVLTDGAAKNISFATV